MKQVVVTGEGVVVREVPAPVVEPGTVLIATAHSCISTGTELSGIGMAETPLWRRALADPSKVGKVLHIAATQGVGNARHLVKQAVTMPTAVGYSAAGTVIEVGIGVGDLQVGDRVAAAGAGSAHHAQVIRVPENLVVRIPDSLSTEAASMATLGAIALQGVRRANPTLGETIVVLGLGVLGQLTVQLLRQDGARVVAADVDSNRVSLAGRLGASAALHASGDELVDAIQRISGGVGADGVIITASGQSDEIVASAFRACRKRGRVVLVGDVGLHLHRPDVYEKELDFLVSTSYGPGRYDRRYEEEGLDYPIGQVRWTERRNLDTVVRLMADGVLRTEEIIGGVVPVDNAPEAYGSLREDEPRPLAMLLSYPTVEAPLVRTIRTTTAAPPRDGAVRIALIGAGTFAATMHVPNLQALDDRFRIQAVVDRTGHRADAIARSVGATFSGTDVAAVLADDAIDAVLIATRHHDHAQLALAALRAGKHVLVEKPTALTRTELEQLEAFYADASSPPVLLTGFNRRFSPTARGLRAALAERRDPAMLAYRINAGRLPDDHWTHGPQGGGRNVGEACHIYDLFTFLLDAECVGVHATPLRPRGSYYRADDNFVATLSFADGSVATLLYTAMGDASVGKEQLEAFADGQRWLLDDYRALHVGAVERGSHGRSATPDKGHRQELIVFADAVQGRAEWPIPLWQQIQAMRIAFEVDGFLGRTQPPPAEH